MDRFRLRGKGGSVPPLELRGCELTDRGVPSLAVEEHLDVVEQRRPGSGPSREGVPMHELCLRVPKKLSATALSRASPTVPIDGAILA
jgi:hypothetical protein